MLSREPGRWASPAGQEANREGKASAELLRFSLDSPERHLSYREGEGGREKLWERTEGRYRNQWFVWL